MENALVLIIEDEREIAETLRAYFERDAFRTVSAADGDTGLSHHQHLKPHLVVLDVNLPGGVDGFEVLAAIRRRGDTPVTMAPALGEDLDKLQAQCIGADNYMVKSFNPLKVVARAKAVLRRACNTGRDQIRVGPLTIDTNAYTASVGFPPAASMLELTRTEFRLLSHKARFANKVFERSELVDACLPEGEALERTVDSHVSNLRRKLSAAGANDLLLGVRGLGYRLSDPRD